MCEMSFPNSACFLCQDSTACEYCLMSVSLLPLMLPRKAGLSSSCRYFFNWSFNISFVTLLARPPAAFPLQLPVAHQQ